MECYQMSARKTHVRRHMDNFSDLPGNRFFFLSVQELLKQLFINIILTVLGYFN